MKTFRCFSIPPIIPPVFLLSFHLWVLASNLKHFVRASASYCSDPEHFTACSMTDIFTIGSLDNFLSCTRTRRSYQRYLAYSFHGFTKINCERRNVIYRRKPKDSDIVWIVIEETDRKVCSIHLVWRLKRKLKMNCWYKSYLSNLIEFSCSWLEIVQKDIILHLCIIPVTKRKKLFTLSGIGLDTYLFVFPSNIKTSCSSNGSNSFIILMTYGHWKHLLESFELEWQDW